MKKVLLVLLMCVSIFLQINGQDKDQGFICNTHQLRSYWLVEFQQDIDEYEKSETILYVPVTLHSVGTDQGDGHIPFQVALDQLCQLNQFFEEADIYFYLDGAINYINNSTWYQGDQIESMMNINNIDNTINCYIAGGDLSRGGLYSSSVDAIYIARNALLHNDHLFAHEIGHYLSLPHTFLGWENTTWNYSMPAPEYIGGHKVERVDLLDCEIAGDGFCDTPPDYLSAVPYFCDINEESYIFQTDPTGATFQTDCSLIMSYALSPHQFSGMQIGAMRANIEQVRPYLLENQSPVPGITQSGVVLTNPVQGAMVSPEEPVTLDWEPVPNATHYLVDITFTPVFSAVYDQYLEEGTSIVLEDLPANKNFRWRVRPYNAFHTCVPYSEEGLFSTGLPYECEQSEIIGNTIYDLQTNASVCNRISRDADGNIMATWTMGHDPGNGYQDRGTGYNRFDESTASWGNIPLQRLEQNTRTGWPNHIITDNGTELIVNHVFTSQGVFLHTLRKTAGSITWVESQIPTNTPRGVITARVAVSGETIHIIAPATPVNFGGMPYEGINGHLLYYRSADGGLTWDIVDGIVPGLDNTFMADLGFVDRYAIDARDNIVSIGVFSHINDVRIFKSEDGGNTWVNTRVHDFPIDMYVPNQGYTLDDLPPESPQQPSPYAIFTTDNSGSVIIDRNGMVHAFYGQMYIQDNDTQDGIIVTFPKSSGIAYWNETFGADSISTIANLADLNGNNMIDVDHEAQIANYNNLSMTTHPSPAVDENNNIYLAYSSVMEGVEYRQNDAAMHFRHIMIIYSSDNGETWSPPYDAINEVTLCDSDFPFFTEAVYPSMVRDIQDEVLFLYQYDFRPGLNAAGDEAETNFIRFTRIPISELGVVSAEEITEAEVFQMKLQPNPANTSATITYKLEQPTQISLQVYNLMGQVALYRRFQEQGVGMNSINLDLSNLATGLYLVQFRAGKNIAVKKLVVR